MLKTTRRIFSLILIFAVLLSLLASTVFYFALSGATVQAQTDDRPPQNVVVVETKGSTRGEKKTSFDDGTKTGTDLYFNLDGYADLIGSKIATMSPNASTVRSKNADYVVEDDLNGRPMGSPNRYILAVLKTEICQIDHPEKTKTDYIEIAVLPVRYYVQELRKNAAEEVVFLDGFDPSDDFSLLFNCNETKMRSYFKDGSQGSTYHTSTFHEDESRGYVADGSWDYRRFGFFNPIHFAEYDCIEVEYDSANHRQNNKEIVLSYEVVYTADGEEDLFFSLFSNTSY